MTTYSGVGVSAGRVIGHIRRMPTAIVEPSAEHADDPARELDRLQDASDAVHADLQRRALDAADAGHDEARSILEVTAHMAIDPQLAKAAGQFITDGPPPNTPSGKPATILPRS